MQDLSLTKADFDRLLLDYRSGTAAQRRDAFRRLEAWDRVAVEHLCSVLRDRDYEVRISAAEVLGSLRAEAAATPLQAILREILGAEWSRTRGLYGPALLLGFLVTFALLLAGAAWTRHYGLLAVIAYPALLAAVLFRDHRIKRDRLLRAAVTALGCIAEARPSASLSPLARDLKTIAFDALLHAPETRMAAREAAQRIERSTHAIRDLPMPSAPGSSESGLPVPSVDGSPNSHGLPRASS